MDGSWSLNPVVELRMLFESLPPVARRPIELVVFGGNLPRADVSGMRWMAAELRAKAAAMKNHGDDAEKILAQEDSLGALGDRVREILHLHREGAARLREEALALADQAHAAANDAEKTLCVMFAFGIELAWRIITTLSAAAAAGPAGEVAAAPVVESMLIEGRGTVALMRAGLEQAYKVGAAKTVARLSALGPYRLALAVGTAAAVPASVDLAAQLMQVVSGDRNPTVKGPNGENPRGIDLQSIEAAGVSGAGGAVGGLAAGKFAPRVVPRLETGRSALGLVQGVAGAVSGLGAAALITGWPEHFEDVLASLLSGGFAGVVDVHGGGHPDLGSPAGKMVDGSGAYVPPDPSTVSLSKDAVMRLAGAPQDTKSLTPALVDGNDGATPQPTNSASPGHPTDAGVSGPPGATGEGQYELGDSARRLVDSRSGEQTPALDGHSNGQARVDGQPGDTDSPTRGGHGASANLPGDRARGVDLPAGGDEASGGTAQAGESAQGRSGDAQIADPAYPGDPAPDSAGAHDRSDAHDGGAHHGGDAQNGGDARVGGIDNTRAGDGGQAGSGGAHGVNAQAGGVPGADGTAQLGKSVAAGAVLSSADGDHSGSPQQRSADHGEDGAHVVHGRSARAPIVDGAPGHEPAVARPTPGSAKVDPPVGVGDASGRHGGGGAGPARVTAPKPTEVPPAHEPPSAAHSENAAPADARPSMHDGPEHPAEGLSEALAELSSADPATKQDLTAEQQTQFEVAAKKALALYRLRREELAGESWEQRRHVMEHGDRVESLLRYIDAMREGTGKTPRWNQLQAFLLGEHGFMRQMGTGQGKSMVGALDTLWQLSRGEPASGDSVRVHHVITTTEVLANEGVREFAPMLRSLGYEVARWDPHDPPGEPDRPTVYYMTYDERATAELFDRPPPGKTATIDEADAVLVHNQTVHYQSEGQRELASDVEAAGVKRVRDFLKAVLRSRITAANDLPVHLEEALHDGPLTAEEAGAVRSLSTEELAAARTLTARLLREQPERCLDTVSRLWEGHTGRKFTAEETEMARAFLDVRAGRLKLNRDFQIFGQGSEKKVQILDEYGKPRSDPKIGTESRWFGGRHKMVEAMFGAPVYSDGTGSKQVTVEDVLAGYEHLHLMSGTLERTAAEIKENFPVEGGLAKVEDFGRSKLTGEEDRIFLREPDKLRDAVGRVQQLQAEGRPVLVICPFNDLARKFSLMLTKAGVEHNAIDARWFAEHRDNNAAEEHLLSVKDAAGVRGAVTVGTGMLGRGFDVSISDEVDQLGGVHAHMLGRSPTNPDEDHQWSARAGRNGRNGSFCFNVAASDRLYSEARQHGAQVAVTHYRTAVAEHAEATAQYIEAARHAGDTNPARPGEALRAARTKVAATAADVHAAEREMRSLISPLQNNAADRAYLQRAMRRAHQAHAPPTADVSAATSAVSPRTAIAASLLQTGPDTVHNATGLGQARTELDRAAMEAVHAAPDAVQPHLRGDRFARLAGWLGIPASVQAAAAVFDTGDDDDPLSRLLERAGVSSAAVEALNQHLDHAPPAAVLRTDAFTDEQALNHLTPQRNRLAAELGWDPAQVAGAEGVRQVGAAVEQARKELAALLEIDATAVNAATARDGIADAVARLLVRGETTGDPATERLVHAASTFSAITALLDLIVAVHQRSPKSCVNNGVTMMRVLYPENQQAYRMPDDMPLRGHDAQDTEQAFGGAFQTFGSLDKAAASLKDRPGGSQALVYKWMNKGEVESHLVLLVNDSDRADAPNLVVLDIAAAPGEAPITPADLAGSRALLNKAVPFQQWQREQQPFIDQLGEGDRDVFAIAFDSAGEPLARLSTAQRPVVSARSPGLSPPSVWSSRAPPFRRDQFALAGHRLPRDGQPRDSIRAATPTPDAQRVAETVSRPSRDVVPIGSRPSSDPEDGAERETPDAGTPEPARPIDVGELGRALAEHGVVVGRAAAARVMGSDSAGGRDVIELSVPEWLYRRCEAEGWAQDDEQRSVLTRGRFRVSVGWPGAETGIVSHEDLADRSWQPAGGGPRVALLADVYAWTQETQDLASADRIKDHLLSPACVPLPAEVIAREIEEVTEILRARVSPEQLADPEIRRGIRLAAEGLFTNRTLYGHPDIGRANHLHDDTFELREFGVAALYHNGMSVAEDVRHIVDNGVLQGADLREIVLAIAADTWSDLVYGGGRRGDNPEGYDELRSARLLHDRALSHGCDAGTARTLGFAVNGTGFDERTGIQMIAAPAAVEEMRQRWGEMTDGEFHTATRVARWVAAADLQTLSEPDAVVQSIELALEDLMSRRFDPARVFGRVLSEWGVRVNAVGEALRLADRFGRLMPEHSHLTVRQALINRLRGSADFVHPDSGHRPPDGWLLGNRDLRREHAAKLREIADRLAGDSVYTPMDAYRDARTHAAEMREKYSGFRWQVVVGPGAHPRDPAILAAAVAARLPELDSSGISEGVIEAIPRIAEIARARTGDASVIVVTSSQDTDGRPRLVAQLDYTRPEAIDPDPGVTSEELRRELSDVDCRIDIETADPLPQGRVWHRLRLDFTRQRILVCCGQWGLGGTGMATLTVSLCQALAKAGHAVTVRTGEVGRAPRIPGVKVIGPRESGSLAVTRERMLSHWDELPELMDLVIVHDSGDGLAAALAAEERYPAAKLVRINHLTPMLFHTLGNNPERGRAKLAADVYLARRAHLVAGLGPVLAADALSSAVMAGHGSVHELQPGLVPAAQPPVPAPGAPARILLFGRADDPLKGVAEIARAVRRLRAAGRDVRLIVRGYPRRGLASARAELVALVGDPDAVEVAPRTSDRAALQADIRSATVVVMPSRAEGFGLVAAEAIEQGVPVVVPSSSGVGRFLTELDEYREQAERFNIVEQHLGAAPEIETWAAAVGSVLDEVPAAWAAAGRLQRLLKPFTRKRSAKMLVHAALNTDLRPRRDIRPSRAQVTLENGHVVVRGEGTDYELILDVADAMETDPAVRRAVMGYTVVKFAPSRDPLPIRLAAARVDEWLFDPSAATAARSHGSRADILRAFVAVVSVQGFGATTIDDVCRRARIPRDVFHDHFPTTSSAFADAHRQARRNLNQLVVDELGAAPAPNRAARVTTAVNTYVSALAARPATARLLLVEGFTADPGARAELTVGMIEEIAATLATVFEESITPTRERRASAAAIYGVLADWAVTGDATAVPALRRNLVDLLRNGTPTPAVGSAADVPAESANSSREQRSRSARQAEPEERERILTGFEAAYAAAVERLRTATRAAMPEAAADDLPSRLRAAINAYLTALAAHPEEARVLHLNLLAPGPGAYGPHDRHRAMLATHFGEVVGEIDARTARLLASAVAGIVTDRILSGRTGSRRSADGESERIATLPAFAPMVTATVGSLLPGSGGTRAADNDAPGHRSTGPNRIDGYIGSRPEEFASRPGGRSRSESAVSAPDISGQQVPATVARRHEERSDNQPTTGRSEGPAGLIGSRPREENPSGGDASAGPEFQDLVLAGRESGTAERSPVEDAPGVRVDRVTFGNGTRVFAETYTDPVVALEQVLQRKVAAIMDAPVARTCLILEDDTVYREIVPGRPGDSPRALDREILDSGSAARLGLFDAVTRTNRAARDWSVGPDNEVRGGRAPSTINATPTGAFAAKFVREIDGRETWQHHGMTRSELAGIREQVAYLQSWISDLPIPDQYKPALHHIHGRYMDALAEIEWHAARTPGEVLRDAGLDARAQAKARLVEAFNLDYPHITIAGFEHPDVPAHVIEEILGALAEMFTRFPGRTNIRGLWIDHLGNENAGAASFAQRDSESTFRTVAIQFSLRNASRPEWTVERGIELRERGFNPVGDRPFHHDAVHEFVHAIDATELLSGSLRQVLQDSWSRLHELGLIREPEQTWLARLPVYAFVDETKATLREYEALAVGFAETDIHGAAVGTPQWVIHEYVTAGRPPQITPDLVVDLPAQENRPGNRPDPGNHGFIGSRLSKSTPERQDRAFTSDARVLDDEVRPGQGPLRGEHFPVPGLRMKSNDPGRNAALRMFSLWQAHVANRGLGKLVSRWDSVVTPAGGRRALAELYFWISHQRYLRQVWAVERDPSVVGEHGESHPDYFRTRLGDDAPNLDMVGHLPGLRAGVRRDPRTGKWHGGVGTPAFWTTLAIGRLVRSRMDVESPGDTVLQNVVELPGGERVDGNVLCALERGRFVIETARAGDQRRIFDAALAELAAAVDQRSPEPSADVLRRFADAVYLLFQAPLMTRGSDATIRTFAATVLTFAFGRPIRLPHDIDLQAMSRRQSDFVEWFAAALDRGLRGTGGSDAPGETGDRPSGFIGSRPGEQSDPSVDASRGAWLKALRLEQGRKQKEVAQAAGLTNAALSNIENGRRTTLGTFQQVCRVLGVEGVELAEATRRFYPDVELETDAAAHDSPGGWVAAHRNNRGMTKTDLARAVGVTPTRIGEIENGDRPPPNVFFRIARALGVEQQALAQATRSLYPDLVLDLDPTAHDPAAPGNWIMALRHANDSPQAEVARTAGTSAGYLAGIEAGEYTPSSIIFRRLCRALEVAPELLRTATHHFYPDLVLGVGPTAHDPAAPGSWIVALRHDRDMTRIDLANAIGPGWGHLGHIESGNYVPRFAAFRRICEVLGIDDELLRVATRHFYPHIDLDLEPAAHDLGGWITALRNDRDMSRAELARVSGLSTKYLAQVETENRRPLFGTFRRICRALGVSGGLLIQAVRDFYSDITADIDPAAHESLGRWFVALRHDEGISATELARRARMPRSTLSSIENNRYLPRLRKLRQLCRAQGVGGELLLEIVERFYADRYERSGHRDEQELFEQYVVTRVGSPEEKAAQDKIFERFAWVPNAVARREAPDIRDDAEQAAWIGMLSAISNHVPSASFAAHAWASCRGAVFRYRLALRFPDLDNRTRKLVSTVEAQIHRMVAAGAALEDTEIARGAGVKPADVALAREILARPTLRLDAPISSDDGSPRLEVADRVPAGFPDTDFAMTVRSALADLADPAIAERLVMLHLVEGMSLTRAAGGLGLPVAAAADVLADAVARLRGAFDHREPADVSTTEQNRPTPWSKTKAEPDQPPTPPVSQGDSAPEEGTTKPGGFIGSRPPEPGESSRRSASGQSPRTTPWSRVSDGDAHDGVAGPTEEVATDPPDGAARAAAWPTPNGAEPFRRWLKAARLARGLTQSRLAAHMGVANSATYIGSLERGVAITREMAVRLLEGLDAPDEVAETVLREYFPDEDGEFPDPRSDRFLDPKDWIIAARTSRGLSRAELAARAGVGLTGLSQKERAHNPRGESGISASYALRLLAGLDAPGDIAAAFMSRFYPGWEGEADRRRSSPIFS
ncbi:helix-turn-helix domain-containing protein [Nocardia exalbida]|uniref:helix-turn-helix domain-containing protein n=1 Tax=Nocardia exalbida TaxID=290231 RepID=UPI00031A5AA9|nr:helix-turn-helix domain-containing protein [Nocardia exalbida]